MNVPDLQAMTDALRSHQPGDTVEIVVRRGTATHDAPRHARRRGEAERAGARRRSGDRGAPRRVRPRRRTGGAARGSRPRRSGLPARPTPRSTSTCCTARSWCSRPSPGGTRSTPGSPWVTGVCGTAVATGQDQNVPDVRAISNYIACNTWTRSELVVLIRRGSHDPGPDRRGQRRPRSVHARRGGGGPEGGGRPGRPALSRCARGRPPGSRSPCPTAIDSPSPSTPVSARRSSREDCCPPTRSRSPTARTAGRSSSCTRRGTWTRYSKDRSRRPRCGGWAFPGVPSSGSVRSTPSRGRVEAARDALDHGLGINLAGGTHHAFPDHGEGFCVFNDVAIAIRVLQREGRITRAAVVDLDVHQGNGTAADLRRRP